VIPFNEFLTNEVFGSATLQALKLTLFYSVLALLVSWMIALFYVFLKNRFVFSLFRFLWVLPGFGFALITLSAFRYLKIEPRYSMLSVLFAWVLAGIPFLALSIQNGVRDLDFRQKEVLQTLGAGPVRAFYLFEFSRTLPNQAFALLQQFWLYLTSFSLVMILSGGFPSETLEVAIYTSVRMDRINFPHALALGFWQILILVPLRLTLNFFHSRTARVEWSGGVRVRALTAQKKTKSSSTPTWIAGAGVVVTLLLSSLSKMELSGLFPSLGTSLLLSGLVTLLTLILVFGLYFLQLGFLAELGAYFSPMLLTLLWWKEFNFTLEPFWNSLLVQLILFAPWMARSLYPILRRARSAELEAARSLGCTPVRAWFQVEWPRIRKTV
jgi:ABC-type Fe3+ transport system permease subunit